MGCLVRLGMMNMSNCEEQIVKCLEKNQMTELLGVRQSFVQLRLECYSHIIATKHQEQIGVPPFLVHGIS